MGGRVHGAEPVLAEVGVDLGGGEVGVAEELLDGAQIGAAVEEVGGVGVAERVGVGDASVAQRVGGHDAVGVAGAQGAAPPVDEHHRGAVERRQLGSSVPAVGGQVDAGGR